MIDVHSHVLPFVDDGSQSVNKSLQMLQESANQGITDVFLTPHYRHPYEKSADEIKKAFDDFYKIVKEKEIPIKLYLGQEIFVGEKDVKKALNEGSVLTMANSKGVLLEFDYVRPLDVAGYVYEIKNAGYIPIVAHVERYAYLTFADIIEIKNLGGMIQVNADSIVGKDRSRKKLVKKLYKYGLVDMVASDVHFGRENLMGKAHEYVYKKFGQAAAEVTFYVNANKLIRG